MFTRTAASDFERLLGPYADFNKRTASSKYSELFVPFFKDLISEMAPVYDISDDPHSYVLAQVKALHADKVNGNGDCAQTSELIQYRPNLGTFVFKSFAGRPHLSEHDDHDLRSSYGILVDADLALADPQKPVRVLIAVDKKKWPDYADGLLSGRRYAYSMGCTAQYCVCSHCANIATVDEEWCEHMKTHKGRYFRGRLMWEAMHGVAYSELSNVASPADQGANSERTLGLFTASQHSTGPRPDKAAAQAAIHSVLSRINPWGAQ